MSVMVLAGFARRVATGARCDGETGIEMSDQLKTWTFCGHWENDRIVVEDVYEGEVEDRRIDTGYWDQGLFAATASGVTSEEAETALRREYEDDEDQCEGHESLDGAHMGESVFCDGSCA